MPKAAKGSLRYGLRWVPWALAVWTPAAAAQLPNQSFEVVPQIARATVGDTVPIRLRVRLDPTDLLYDTVPQPIAALPDGVRLVSVEKLHRDADRTMVGRAVVVFFHPGRQAVPVFGLPFMRGVKGLTRGTLPSDSAFVDILPVAPPGNPELKDIREPADRRAPDWWAVAGALAATGALGAELRRRRLDSLSHQSASPASPSPSAAPPPPDPYEQARLRLEQIERSGWAVGGDLARHYAAVADVLRAYLEAAHGIPALHRTSRELASSLPPALTSTGPTAPLTSLLAEADLVKFARLRPDPAAADRVVRNARLLLEAWEGAESRSRGQLATLALHTRPCFSAECTSSPSSAPSPPASGWPSSWATPPTAPARRRWSAISSPAS